MILYEGFLRNGFIAAVIFVIICFVSVSMNSRALLNTSYKYSSILRTIVNPECRKLPDILIIGIEKCGTITFRSFLGIHPNIYIPDSQRNNKFFNGDSNKTLEEFIADIPCTPDGMLRLEKIATPGLPKLVYKYIPDVKLIALVKEPVERALSHFVHLRDRRLIPGNVTDFDEVVSENGIILSRALHFSLYADRMRPWVKVFGADRILFLDGDSFVKDPVSELAKAETFIGLPNAIRQDNFEFNKVKNFYCIKTVGNSTCMQKSKGRPHPIMREDTRKTLTSFMRPYNELFFDLIGKRFPWNS